MLKQWLLQHFYDFQEEPKLLEWLNKFIEEVMIPEAMVSAGEQLKNIVRKQLDHEKNSKDKEPQFSGRPPAPILPINLRKVPMEVRQFSKTLSACYFLH